VIDHQAAVVAALSGAGAAALILFFLTLFGAFA